MASSPCAIASGGDTPDGHTPLSSALPSTPTTPRQQKASLGPGRGSVCSTSSVFDKTLVANATPPRKGSVAGASKEAAGNGKKTQAKNTQPNGRVRRPPNAFMIFRSWFLRSDKLPQITQMSQASRILGAVWHNLPASERREWHALAAARPNEPAPLCPGGNYDPVKPPSPAPCDQPMPAPSPPPKGCAVQVPHSLELRTLHCAELALHELGDGGAALERAREARTQTRRMRRARLEGVQEDIIRLERRQRNRLARRQNQLNAARAQETEKAAPTSFPALFVDKPHGSPVAEPAPLPSDGLYPTVMPAMAPATQIDSVPSTSYGLGLAVDALGMSTLYATPAAPSLLAPTTVPSMLWPTDAPDMQTSFFQPIPPSNPAPITTLPPNMQPLSSLGFAADVQQEFALPFSAPAPNPVLSSFLNNGMVDDSVLGDLLRDCGVSLPLPGEQPGPTTEIYSVPAPIDSRPPCDTNPNPFCTIPMPQPPASTPFPSDWDFYGREFHLPLPPDMGSDYGEDLDVLAMSLNMSPLAPDPPAPLGA